MIVSIYTNDLVDVSQRYSIERGKALVFTTINTIFLEWPSDTYSVNGLGCNTIIAKTFYDKKKTFQKRHFS